MATKIKTTITKQPKTWTMDQKVKFTTNHGRAGKGEIVGIKNTARGQFYTVRDGDGSETMVRAGQLKAA